MATLAEHIAARSDQDLLARITAAAEVAGIPAPAHWASTHAGQIVSTDVEGSNLATVHAFAVSQYEPTPRPGEDPSRVTDSQIEAAVAAVLAGQQEA